jgi:phosphoribosylglycinamide formyltransferase-1
MRIGVLISGTGSNLQAILDACRAGRIDGEVVFIGSDNPQAPGLERGRRQNIPALTVDYRGIISRIRDSAADVAPPPDFDLQDILARQSLLGGSVSPEQAKAFLLSRAVAEAELLSVMKPHPFDLLVLAGFMRTLTPYFIDRVNVSPAEPRIMNIHPALLPAFPGIDGYGDTYRYGCKIAGCTVHFVDYGEDSGPIIAQKAFPISENDTLESVRKKGLELEWELYPECIQLFARRRLKTITRQFTGTDGKTMHRTVVRIISE